ncbi:hypothetical protein FAGKG844_550027 [Frankia sp. AgKG'84/4]
MMAQLSLSVPASGVRVPSASLSVGVL